MMVVPRSQFAMEALASLSRHAANLPAANDGIFAAGQAGDLLFQKNQPKAEAGSLPWLH